MSRNVVVVGSGMITAVGLSAQETITSIGAGLSAFEETSILDAGFQPFVLAEVPEEGLPPLADRLDTVPLTARESRLLRLATAPLRECCGLTGDEDRPLGLYLALPSAETSQPLDGDTFLRWLDAQVPDTLDLGRSVAPFRGRAGGLIAIARGAEAIRNGQREIVIAGGVDTYRDLYVLGTLDREQRIKTEQRMDGFIPGEGAGFLLLASEEAAAARGLPVLARLEAWAQGMEEGHLYSEAPYKGEGLANTLKELLATAAGGPVAQVHSSMNGESHWAKEWGVAFIRNSSLIEESYDMHHPADCIGDTGAAAGPVLAGVASSDSGAGGPRLVYASSDRGERAALLFTH